MNEKPLSKELLSTGDLAPEDLREVYENIEDYLAFWQVLNNERVLSQEDGLPVSLAQVNAAADWLKMSSAPLYPSQDAQGLRGVIYRALNGMIKILGSPQIRFNRKFRVFLGEQIQAFQLVNNQAAALKAAVDDLRRRIRALEVENYELRQEIEILNGQTAEIRGASGQPAGERGSSEQD